MAVRLPDPWYFTLPELAFDWGCHVDRVVYYLDAGLLVPSALVPKALLPGEIPGPAPHVCVMLPDYRHMRWEHSEGAAIAPLVGEFQAFAIDGLGFCSLLLSDLDHVYVERTNLVVTINQREEIEGMQSPPRSVRPNERRTLMTMIGTLAEIAYGKKAAKPYQVAEQVREQAQLRGHTLSKQAIADKLREAAAVLASVESADASKVG